MNPAINPYLPPQTRPAAPSRLSEIARLFRRFPLVRTLAFCHGDTVIVDGIAFYLDPKDSSLIFAASPSAKSTDERMSLVVKESIRALPELFLHRPALKRLLRGRRLVVRLAGSYAEAGDTTFREESLDWDTVVRRIQDGG